MSARRAAALAVALASCLAVQNRPVLCAGAPGGPVRLVINPQKSSLTFTIHRPGETIEGAVGAYAGELVFEPSDLSRGGSVALHVAAASLTTGNRVRDHKMRNAHLEVERYPEVVFRSTSIRVGADRGGDVPAALAPCVPSGGGRRRALVDGVLSLHGVDRSLMVPAAIRYDNGVLTAEGCVNLTYSDYRIPIPRFLWLVMEDDIQVRFRFVASAAAP
jgi:hypothetical protein